MDVFVGRQPIFESNRRVHGYELLFRRSLDATTAGSAGDLETTQVIVSTFTEFGLHSLVGESLAFVNLTRPFLVGTMPIPFAPDGTVLEVLEDIEVDPALLSGLTRLSTQGYRLALDDFELEPAREALLPLADYVKVDLLNPPLAGVEEVVAACRAYDVTLVAEKIDTAEHLAQATELGFDLLQGYHLLRPQVVHTRTLTPSRVVAVNLLSRMADPDVTVADVEAVVRADPALGIRVLHASNSAAAGLRRRVTSVRDALTMLGLDQLRSWVMLMVLAGVSEGGREQLATAMVRARACELLARRLGLASGDSAFVVGLLSHLDALFGQPLPSLVASLHLADELESALLAGSGPLGAVLSAVKAYERADDTVVRQTGTSVVDAARAYLEALGWSLVTLDEVSAA